MATKTVGVQPPWENPVEGVLKFLDSLERVEMEYKPELTKVIGNMQVWEAEVNDPQVGGINFRLSAIGEEKRGLSNIILTWTLPTEVGKYCSMEGIDYVSVELDTHGDRKYRHGGVEWEWPSKPDTRIRVLEDFFTRALDIVMPKLTSKGVGVREDIIFQSAKIGLMRANMKNPPPGSGEEAARTGPRRSRTTAALRR